MAAGQEESGQQKSRRNVGTGTVVVGTKTHHATQQTESLEIQNAWSRLLDHRSECTGVNSHDDGDRQRGQAGRQADKPVEVTNCAGIRPEKKVPQNRRGRAGQTKSVEAPVVSQQTNTKHRFDARLDLVGMRASRQAGSQWPQWQESRVRSKTRTNRSNRDGTGTE